MVPTRLHLPLLEHEPSETPVFTAANLLRAARIRKGLPKVSVPAGCLPDFDGELVQHLAATYDGNQGGGFRKRWRCGACGFPFRVCHSS